MKPIRILCLGLVLWWGAAVGYAAEDSKFWEDLPKRADAWKKGEPIPPELLEYRSSHQEGACFPDPRGTYSIFAGLTNYALLREISFTPKIDDRVFTNAVNNAIRLGGPTRFFADLTAFRAENPNLSKLKRIKALQKQASLKHIVVDIIFIDFVDMAPDAAMQALQSMKAELQGGKA